MNIWPDIILITVLPALFTAAGWAFRGGLKGLARIDTRLGALENRMVILEGEIHSIAISRYAL